MQSIPESKSCFYNPFCSGGINHEDPFNSVDNVDNGVMVFFRDYFAKALNTVSVKIAVLLLFLGYLVTFYLVPELIPFADLST